MTTSKLIIAISVFSAASVFAGWEDTGVTPAPSKQPDHQSTSSQQFSGSSYQGQQRYAQPARTITQHQQPPAYPNTQRYSSQPAVLPNDLYSAFLDTGDESESWYKLSVISKADLEETENGFGRIDIDTHFALLDLRNVLYGDMTLELNPAVKCLTDDAGLNFMPTFLVEVPLEISWIWRYLNGWSFELGAAPGIYADIKTFIDASMFSMPFSGCFYYNFSQETAVRFGIEIRPGWDQIIMPLVGIAWQPTEMFRAELGLPRSLVDLQVGPVDIYGKIQWNNKTFALDDGGNNPEDVTFNEWQIGGGVSVSFTDSCRLAFELGILAGRDVTFRDSSNDVAYDVDSAPYFGVLFGKEF